MTRYLWALRKTPPPVPPCVDLDAELQQLLSKIELLLSRLDQFEQQLQGLAHVTRKDSDSE